MKSAMPNGRCYIHGGATPSGIASPHFKTGRDSKYLKHLPATLAPYFDAANPNLVSLTEELALVDAGIVELLEQAKGAKRVSLRARKELWDLVERRSRLVSVESRRRKDEHDMVERMDFARFAKALLMAVATHLEDRGLRQKIQDDVLRVLAISQVPLLASADGEVA